MNAQSSDDSRSKAVDRSNEVRSFSVKYWWLNFIRGIAALLLGLGLLLPVEILIGTDHLHSLLFQFIGIYLLVSGLMSLIWGLSNHRRFGLWLIAAALGLIGGIIFILKPFLEGFYSVELLTTLFGIIMLLAGMLHFLGGFRLGKTYGRRWSLGHEFLGLVEIAIAILLLISAFVPVQNLRIFVSFWGLVAGVGLIVDGTRMRKAKIQQEE